MSDDPYAPFWPGDDVVDWVGMSVYHWGNVAGEEAVKAGWWRQVTDPEIARRFRRVQMVNWFEWDKQENEIGGRVDWTVTRSATSR